MPTTRKRVTRKFYDFNLPDWQLRYLKIGEIPPDAQCIKNLRCVGGLTLHEFTTLPEEEKQRRLAGLKPFKKGA